MRRRGGDGSVEGVVVVVVVTWVGEVDEDEERRRLRMPSISGQGWRTGFSRW